MRTCCPVPAVLGLVLAALGGPAHAAAPTPLPQRADILGWEAVGRVETGSGGRCSGALIAPTIVLTAAHCVIREDGTPAPVAGMLFRSGLRDGAEIAAVPVRQATVPAGYVRQAHPTVDAVRRDIALLELAAPIPATTASPFRVALPGPVGSRVTLVAYGMGGANTMTRQLGCALRARQDGIGAYDCASRPGVSGAPIFDMSSRVPRIVSVVSGGGDWDGRRVTFGADLPQIVAALRRQLRTGAHVWPAPLPATGRRITEPAADMGSRRAGGARFLRP